MIWRGRNHLLPENYSRNEECIATLVTDFCGYHRHHGCPGDGPNCAAERGGALGHPDHARVGELHGVRRRQRAGTNSAVRDGRKCGYAFAQRKSRAIQDQRQYSLFRRYLVE